jgi:RNA polymerase sigma-70 factor (ECF subfamily)
MDINLESEYLRKLSAGDHAAFDSLFMLYHPLVKRFLLGFVKNEEDVRDMAQNIFYNVWTHRKTAAEVDNFRAYLYRMARNAVYNYFKINAIHEEHLHNYQREAIVVDDLQEERLYAEELGLLLDLAIENMPPQRKLVFKMSRKDGLTNDEISKMLNISKPTVENHITKALADLRKVIKGVMAFFV